MAEPLRHRQTKEAATDMFYLKPPRHISTLPISTKLGCPGHVWFIPGSDRIADITERRFRANARNRCAIARCAGSPTASAVTGGKIVKTRNRCALVRPLRRGGSSAKRQ